MNHCLWLFEHRTGEEDEEEQFSAKAKLYRFDDGEWKERGVGPLKVLLHKGNGMMRILMRREKTLKICANHLVAPGTNLSPHMDSEKCFVWSAMDYADEEAKAEMFCIRCVLSVSSRTCISSISFGCHITSACIVNHHLSSTLSGPHMV